MITSAVAATRLAESLGSVADQVKLLNHVARLNTVPGNHQRALALLQEVQVIARSIGFIDAQANLYLDEGHIHALNGDRAKQLMALRLAMAGLDDVAGGVMRLEQAL